MKRRTGIAASLLAAALLCSGPAVVRAQDDVRTEIQQIKQQLTEMDALKAKLAELEKRLDETKKAQESSGPTVTSAFKGAKIKIDGRIFAGAFKSEGQGNFPKLSTNINDAKLRFTFNPWKNVTIVNRLSATNTQSPTFDYFYLDYSGIPNASSVLRIGQRKVDFGQETWVDNPIENVLVSNAISHVSGYATGIALNGKLGSSKTAPVYEIGISNGPITNTSDQKARNSNGVQTNIKIGTPFAGKLFASASYFNSNSLKGTDNSSLSVAEINSAPTGASEWKRKLYELDLRYNYGPTGIRSAIPSTNKPKVMAGATWGKWNDEATGASDRDGNYWFAEAMYNFTPKLYSAARYSKVSLDDGVLAALGKSPAAVNEYTRTSIGLGYRLNELTDVKAEYSINHTSGGASEPGLNQWGVGVATKF